MFWVLNNKACLSIYLLLHVTLAYIYKYKTLFKGTRDKHVLTMFYVCKKWCPHYHMDIQENGKTSTYENDFVFCKYET